MNPQKIKILVDGNCIVCDREVAYYKKLKPDIFELIDISDPKFSAKDFNLDADAVNKKMHLLMPDGKVLKAIDAFLVIWENLGPEHRYFQRLRKFISFPLIRPFADIGYNIFAFIRPWLPKNIKKI